MNFRETDRNLNVAMAGKRFDPEKLAHRLAPHRFVLNLPEVMKDGISFVRPSLFPRLYEHLRIHAANPVYAETVISAASLCSCHPCVSEQDNRLRELLSGHSWPNASRISTLAAAKAWQKLLVENADVFCTLAASTKGPELIQLLQPVFKAVESYIQRLGDIFSVFDKEFAFVNQTSSDKQTEIDWLATQAHNMLYLNSEDAKLVSLALVRFGTEVEEEDNPFHGKLPRSNDGLGARFILLADHVRRKRTEYENVGGLCR